MIKKDNNLLNKVSLDDIISMCDRENQSKCLIGIAGASGSGKDTLFRYLDKKSKKKLRNIKFADSLKGIVYSLFSIPIDILGGVTNMDREFKETPLSQFGGRTPREILQRVGMAMREIDEDVWVRQAMNFVLNKETSIITDVRFMNEALAVKKAGGTLIYISSQLEANKMGAEWIDEEKKIAVGSHVSESGIVEIAPLVDMVIDQSAMNWIKEEVYGGGR